MNLADQPQDKNYKYRKVCNKSKEKKNDQTNVNYKHMKNARYNITLNSLVWFRTP